MNIDFPFHFDDRGRTAATDDDDHIRDMIEQLLFTNAGERVNRPDFGSGLLQLVFAPNSPELAAALAVHGPGGAAAWLGDLIEVRAARRRRASDSTAARHDRATSSAARGEARHRGRRGRIAVTARRADCARRSAGAAPSRGTRPERDRLRRGRRSTTAGR